VGKPTQITGTRRGPRARGPRMLPTFLYFSVVSEVNLVVIYRVDGTCGQRSSCGRRLLLCFLPFPLPNRPCWGGGDVYRGPNPLSAALGVTTCDTDNVMVLLTFHVDQNMLRLFIKCYYRSRIGCANGYEEFYVHGTVHP